MNRNTFRWSCRHILTICLLCIASSAIGQRDIIGSPRQALDRLAGFELEHRLEPTDDVNYPVRRNLIQPMKSYRTVPISWELPRQATDVAIADARVEGNEVLRKKALKQLQAEFESLRKQLGNNHPLVIAQEQRIKALQEHEHAEQAREHAENHRQHADHEETPGHHHDPRQHDGLHKHEELREHPEHHEPPQQRDREPREHAELAEGMRRVHALHEAGERLAQGGLEEMARDLHHRAEQMEREIHHHREHGAPPEAVLREVMENMEQVRHEVRELHEKLDLVIRKLNSPRPVPGPPALHVRPAAPAERARESRPRKSIPRPDQ